MSSVSEISIPLYGIERDLYLNIYAEQDNSLSVIDEELALKYGESRFQLKEGCQYEYQLSNSSFQLQEIPGLVSNSKVKTFSNGRISPGIYVGTLTLFIVNSEGIEKGNVEIEVCSVKTEYRTDYRFMLESITRKCTELLMQVNSPVSQHFEQDFEKNNKTIYQRFAFIHSILTGTEFNDAVQRIIQNPNTKWKTDTELKDIRRVKKIGRTGVRQLVGSAKKICLPTSHFLNQKYGLESVAEKIITDKKVETTDTSENRFIKHALYTFLQFCIQCSESFEYGSRNKREADVLVNQLQAYLNHVFFREIGKPQTLKLNSPLLQRKSGYKEILSYWIMFDLAAKLKWEGGEKVYSAGKRNIATLYEYWLFFTLLDILKKVFDFNEIKNAEDEIEHFIEKTSDGLSLMLKSGADTTLTGTYTKGNRKLNVRFSYNKTFAGDRKYNDKKEGSWTKPLRPDYTLSIWPSDITSVKAEELEMIVHIHFDAKYKVNQFIIEKEVEKTEGYELDSLEKEKTDELKGIYKNADLLKMHAYKDAIRRTGGAYILYPGNTTDINHTSYFRGFHELIPGLGAFAIRPKEIENGSEELEIFVNSVVEHFLDRSTQRENLSSKIYSIHRKTKRDDDILKEPLPETCGNADRLIPDDTFVMVGFYNSPEHLKWFEKSGLYNFRTGTGNGSLVLSPEMVNSKFLLLHTSGDSDSGILYRIKSDGPKVYSKNDLISKGYPTEPSQEFYLVVEINTQPISEFENMRWQFKNLAGYKSGHQSSNPFSVSLKELMRVKV